jgi:UDP-glucose:(heptosyl)LPS alpha-1,3-glucosyltransferase
LAREPFDCVFSLERTWRQDVYRAGDGVHRVWLERRRQFAPWWRRPFIGWGGFHRTMLALERKTFDPANTRRIIVNSNMVREEILRHFPFPAERLHLVRNGVETARFQAGRRAEARRRFGVAEDEHLLLFVGSGWERKGLKFLLDALSKARELGTLTEPYLGRLYRGADLPKMRLLVVGRGTPPAPCPEGVIFQGPMPDVEQTYAAADLFVFLPIYEPSANVCFEALAAGLPVVTTRQNGAHEIIEEGVNGSVVGNPADPWAVATAILTWCLRGRSRFSVKLRTLGLERNVRETIAVLELAARERGSPAS